MSKLLYFYGTKNDVLAVTQRVESKIRIKYVRYGNTTTLPPETFDSAADIPNLGTASHPSAVACDNFVVCDVETEINPEQLKTLTESDVGRSDIVNTDRLRSLIGLKRYAIDQLINPDTITFGAGGLWKDGTLLHGSIGTASESERSLALLKEFLSAVRKTFIKVRAFHVGPEALVLLKNGARLTIAVQSPPEYNLKLDEG